jgi:selenocysteine lyase/cysteine desulfurase
MNANELADELDGFLKEQEQLPWGTKQVYLDQAATMLRQQQAEIKKWTDQYQRLNENLEMWKAGHFKQQAEIEALKNIIANLTRINC